MLAAGDRGASDLDHGAAPACASTRRRLSRPAARRRDGRARRQCRWRSAPRPVWRSSTPGAVTTARWRRVQPCWTPATKGTSDEDPCRVHRDRRASGAGSRVHSPTGSLPCGRSASRRTSSATPGRLGGEDQSGDRVGIRVVSDPEHGIVDYVINPAPESSWPRIRVWLRPMEARSLRSRCCQAPGMPDAVFEQQVSELRRELTVLKAHLETACPL